MPRNGELRITFPGVRLHFRQIGLKVNYPASRVDFSRKIEGDFARRLPQSPSSVKITQGLVILYVDYKSFDTFVFSFQFHFLLAKIAGSFLLFLAGGWRTSTFIFLLVVSQLIRMNLSHSVFDIDVHHELATLHCASRLGAVSLKQNRSRISDETPDEIVKLWKLKSRPPSCLCFCSLAQETLGSSEWFTRC